MHQQDAYSHWATNYKQNKSYQCKSRFPHSSYQYVKIISPPNVSTLPPVIRTSIRGDYNQKKNEPPTHQPINDDVLKRLFFQKGIDISHSTRLGSGRYSKVITAKQYESENGQQYRKIAIKVINKEKVTREFREKFLPREIDCWRQLLHPNLVRILGHYAAMNYVFLTMEFGERGDLLSYVQKNSAVAEPQAREWLTQIIHGVGYMHSRGIAHRDLKLENIIIFGDGNIKVADFGFSRKLTQYPYFSETYCGSKSYAAPEILQGHPYNPFKADVWSIGVIGFIVVTDTMPYRENCPNSQIIDSQRLRSYRYPRHLNISSPCISSIDKMMTFNAIDRPAITECLRLPFFLNDGLSFHRQ